MPSKGYPHAHPYWSANAHTEPKRHHHRDSGCPRLGHAIAKARISADLKQADLAERLGVARSRVAQWEGAKRPVPWRILELLADVLETPDPWSTATPYYIYMRTGHFARLPE